MAGFLPEPNSGITTLCLVVVFACRHFIVACLLCILCILKALRSRLDGSIASANTRQSVDHASFNSTVAEQQEYVTSTVSSFTASLQQMTDQLQQCSQDVDHFLSTELQQDMPTGNVASVCCLPLLCYLTGRTC